jgi:hypothetical protein
MRRLTAWVGGAASGIAAYRLLRRRPRPEAAVEPEPDERAEELRSKLAESRTAEPVAGPVAEEEPATEPESPEERRRRVHEEGRTALDDMKSE